MAVDGSYSFDPATEKDSRSRRRRIAEQLMAQGMETTPIQSPWQGAARMAQALMGGIELGMEDKKEREQTEAIRAQNSGLLERTLGGGGEASPVARALFSVPEGRGAAAPGELAPLFDEAARATGIPAPILMAKARQESNFNPGAIGKAGEVGVTQILPSTARDPGFGMQGVDPSALRDPKTNIMFGAQYLAARAKAAGVKDWNDPQQVAKALTAYNGGGDPNYAQNVMRFAPNGMFRVGGGEGGPIQVAQAGGQTMNDASGRMQQLLRDYNNPLTTETNRKLILSEIERLRKGSDPAAALDRENKSLQNQKLRNELNTPPPTPLTPEERQQLGIRPDIPAYRQGKEIKFGPAGTTINNMPGQKGDTEFEKEGGGIVAKRYGKFMEAGDGAAKMVSDINIMREISRSVGQQGAGASFKEAIGPYAEALGIDVSNLDEIQTWASILKRLAPQQRTPGSGATSDIEYKGMIDSIGKLSNTPKAREMILDTLEASARYEMTRAEIAERALAGEITRADANKLIRDLPDPMTAFRQFKKDNPDAFKGGAPVPPPASGATPPPAGNTTKRGVQWSVQ